MCLYPVENNSNKVSNNSLQPVVNELQRAVGINPPMPSEKPLAQSLFYLQLAAKGPYISKSFHDLGKLKLKGFNFNHKPPGGLYYNYYDHLAAMTSLVFSNLPKDTQEICTQFFAKTNFENMYKKYKLYFSNYGLNLTPGEILSLTLYGMDDRLEFIKNLVKQNPDDEIFINAAFEAIFTLNQDYYNEAFVEIFTLLDLDIPQSLNESMQNIFFWHLRKRIIGNNNIDYKHIKLIPESYKKNNPNNYFILAKEATRSCIKDKEDWHFFKELINDSHFSDAQRKELIMLALSMINPEYSNPLGPVQLWFDVVSDSLKNDPHFLKKIVSLVLINQKKAVLNAIEFCQDIAFPDGSLKEKIQENLLLFAFEDANFSTYAFYFLIPSRMSKRLT
ncbi:MAG: hypothetical protein OMM_04639 [Candidatus Magnetoglobus multicellularis str. Araruama]|uniref:Uncharacterized protein n=1 Tax=Candidatus Magnetoglobus multicellularis str. Araruama TaxID=890399 RepID=A0A1V1P0F7_9BACT|nr:MAG: hypothetical protein OMM_04639 [Candidatus Magnetoglobus multicellularis str. Araruama]